MTPEQLLREATIPRRAARIGARATRCLVSSPLSRFAVAALLSTLSCDRDAPSVGTSNSAAFAHGIVAQVGADRIAATTVAAIADAQKIPVREALDRAVYDARFAAAGRAVRPDLALQVESTILARALHRRIWHGARSVPIGEDELEDATLRHFVAYDRPEGARVVHAVVRLAAGAPERERADARSFAERLHAKVSAAMLAVPLEPAPVRVGEKMFTYSPDDAPDAVDVRFKAAVLELDKGKLEVVVEQLPLVGPDGVMIDYGFNEPQFVVEAFAKAAFRLNERGSVSEIVETELGLHVIALLQRTPAFRASRTERLAQLSGNIQSTRARRERRTLLERLRTENPVEIAANADSLMGERVQAPPPTP